MSANQTKSTFLLESATLQASGVSPGRQEGENVETYFILSETSKHTDICTDMEDTVEVSREQLER